MDFSFSELLLCLIVAIVVLGKDLPKTMRQIGGWVHQMRRKWEEIQEEIEREGETKAPAPEPSPAPAPSPSENGHPPAPGQQAT